MALHRTLEPLRILPYLLFAGLISLASCSNSTQNPQVASDQDTTKQSASIQISIDAKGFIPNDTVELSAEEGKPLTESIRGSKDMQFELKTYEGLGHLVTGINGLKNEDQAGHYWQCCIDGTYADRGIDEIIVKDGMRVSWYYRAYGESPCKKIGEK